MQNMKCLMLGVGLFCLFGCGSSNKTPSAPITNQQQNTQSEDPVLEREPDYYLQQGQLSYAQTGNRTLRNQWIMRAAEAFKQQNACEQTRKTLLISLPELSDSVLRNQAHLLLAECELQRGANNWQQLEHHIRHIDPQVSHRNRAMRLFSAYHASKQNWLAAAKSLYQAYNGEAQDSTTIWYYLQALSEAELKTASLGEPDLAPWLQLSLLVRQYGLQTQTLASAVSQWQAQYPQHPLSVTLPVEVQAGVLATPLMTQKVAVLLPLSGRLEQQGLAIKEGVLSAYLQLHHRVDTADTEQQNEQPILHFFDSQNGDTATLVEQVKDYDLVIGPLLKDKLTEFVSMAPTRLNIVGLNRVDAVMQPVELDPPQNDNLQQTLALDEMEQDKFIEIDSDTPGLRIYFALSPEDEAVQLAQKVFKTGATYPILIAQDGGTAKRMADTFIQTWLSLDRNIHITPGLATYTDNKSMRDSLTALLDVKQSRDRIDQVERLTSEQVHSVPRNRRDIDAIILFASPEETELLNPMVEASLSPFDDKVVPVYASSRSFSENFSNNSLRDLRNIIFTDMPWMLPSETYSALKSETGKIWPERDDTLKRLFALGYDAYLMLPNLAALSSMPQISVTGLTGQLSVDPMGNVIRILSFGKITENDVILLALD